MASAWYGVCIGMVIVCAPLVYQSTTSLGLRQVQMPRPKEVVATRAAARGSKKWYNFFCRNKVFAACQVRSIFILSGITSVFSHSNLVPIWCRPGGYSNEHVRAFKPSTVYTLFYKSKVIIVVNSVATPNSSPRDG